MFQNVPYRLVPLARCVLAKLYVEHVNDNNVDAFSVDEIKAKFSVSVSRNLIGSALEEFHGPRYSDSALINRTGTKKVEWRYKISSAGIQFVEKALRDSSSDIAYFLSQGDKSLDEIAGMDGLFWTQEEHVERSGWAEIDIEPGEEIDELVKGLEKTVKEIDKSNEFEGKYPREKHGILASLETGISKLRSLKISKNQANALIVQPLRWIATTFANTVLGEAAKATAQKLVRFILSYLAL